MNGDAMEIIKHIDAKVGPIYDKLDEIKAQSGKQDTRIAVHDEKISSLEKGYFSIKSHAWKVLGWILGPAGLIGLIFAAIKSGIIGGGK